MSSSEIERYLCKSVSNLVWTILELEAILILFNNVIFLYQMHEKLFVYVSILDVYGCRESVCGCT